MKVITKAVALILYLTIIANGATKGNYLFSKQSKNLNCHMMQTKTIQSPAIRNEPAFFCAASCIRAASEQCPCSGWREENGVCKMCYKCNGGGSTSPFNATYTRPAPVIEVGMDSINGGIIPAFGVHGEVRASGTPGPEIQSGKFNNAIYLPNENKYDDNCIDLGNSTGNCPYSLTVCPKGLTVSLWYKIESNMDWTYAALVSGRDWHFRILRRNEAVGYRPFVVFINDTDSRVLWGQSYLQLNEWHQVAFVFRDFDNTKLFIDGQLDRQTTSYATWTERRHSSMKVGCEVGLVHAARVTFDQLQIWDYAKSDEEIAHVYNFGE